MAVSLVYQPVLVFRDANDVPLPFAKVYSYAAGTTTPLALYANPTGATPLSNPAICDASGRLVAYMTVGVAYKLNVLDQNSVQVPGWPIDYIQVTPNGAPSLIAPSWTTIPQRLATIDPGDAGTEVFPTSQSEELAMYRFVLAEMKGTSDFGTSFVQKEKQGDVLATGMDTNFAWPDGATSGLLFTFRVPYDYHSGPISFSLGRRATAGSGTAVMPYNIARIRTGASLTVLSSGNINFTPADTVTHVDSLSIGAGDVILGDWIKISVSRLGLDGGDGSLVVAFDGHIFQYTGYAGR